MPMASARKIPMIETRWYRKSMMAQSCQGAG